MTKVLYETMKTSELKRRLLKAGCFHLRDGKRHEIWMNPRTGGMTEVGRHGSQEVSSGTLRKIYSDLFGQ